MRVDPDGETAEADDPIEAVITIPEPSVPTGTADMSELTLQVLLRDGSETGVGVFSLQQVHLVDASPTNIPGGYSFKSELAEFKLVQEFTVPPVPPDTTRPTVTVDAPDTNMLASGMAVFMIEFSEELSTGVAGFSFDDLTITGGTAMMADLTGSGTSYTLNVTPNDADSDGTPDDGTITVSVGDQIEDANGNQIDLSMGTPSASMLIDMTPPMVVAHSSMEVMAPAGAPTTGNYLAFTFTFDEAIMLSSFTVSSIDQGSSHNIGSLATSYFGPMDVSGMAIDAADPTAVYADNSYQITVPISDTAADTTIVLKVGTNAIEDMYGNALASLLLRIPFACQYTASV